jgi:hypothetical protein
LKVFDSRIKDLLFEEDASLRDCREIVAGMLADLEARLPDEYPPKLTVLLAFEDGREEGSKHPNFILDESKRVQIRSTPALYP